MKEKNGTKEHHEMHRFYVRGRAVAKDVQGHLFQGSNPQNRYSAEAVSAAMFFMKRNTLGGIMDAIRKLRENFDDNKALDALEGAILDMRGFKAAYTDPEIGEDKAQG